MNQRQIKFRVWDKDRNRMIYDEEVLFHPHPQGWVLVYLAEKSGPIRVTEKNGIVMQFTGLYDKDGKEIYEEDVIDFLDEYYDDGTTALVVVKYGDLTECTSCDSLVGFYVKVIDKGWRDYIRSLDLGTTRFKVIGNTYENPELLEVEE